MDTKTDEVVWNYCAILYIVNANSDDALRIHARFGGFREKQKFAGAGIRIQMSTNHSIVVSTVDIVTIAAVVEPVDSFGSGIEAAFIATQSVYMFWARILIMIYESSNVFSMSRY